MYRARAVLIWCSTFLPLHPAAAQTTVEVPSDVSCRRCRIEAVQVIDLDEVDVPHVTVWRVRLLQP
jgi:hypothetical protein